VLRAGRIADIKDERNWPVRFRAGIGRFAPEFTLRDRGALALMAARVAGSTCASQEGRCLHRARTFRRFQLAMIAFRLTEVPMLYLVQAHLLVLPRLPGLTANRGMAARVP
jgi:hypothetical protein